LPIVSFYVSHEELREIYDGVTAHHAETFKDFVKGAVLEKARRKPDVVKRAA
jgi:hypothetical protein